MRFHVKRIPTDTPARTTIRIRRRGRSILEGKPCPASAPQEKQKRIKLTFGNVEREEELKIPRRIHWMRDEGG